MIKEILGKDVISKCDIKYELAKVSVINFKWGLISRWLGLI